MRLKLSIALLMLSTGIPWAYPSLAQPRSGETTAKPRPVVVIRGQAPTIETKCPASPKAQLQDVSCSEAAALIARLKEVQTKLKDGKPLYFDLLSGGPASNPMTNVSPRKAFTDARFEDAFIVKREKTDNRLWRPYKFAYRPAGAGENIWYIEVVLGFTDERLMRVEMRYGPPPPF